MDALDIASVVVALIAAAGAWLSRKAAANADKANVNTTARVEMEKEAYVRARQFDTDTIEHQDREIAELRKEVEELRAVLREEREDYEKLHQELTQLRQRLARIERGIDPNSKEPIRERATDIDPGAVS